MKNNKNYKGGGYENLKKFGHMEVWKNEKEH